jgi:hypothetical protein
MDATGAALGCVGLIGFAATVWKLLPERRDGGHLPEHSNLACDHPMSLECQTTPSIQKFLVVSLTLENAANLSCFLNCSHAAYK